METSNICICGKYGKYICSKCKSEHYCSLECQNRDWITHKKECVSREKKIDSNQSNNSTNKYLDTQMKLFNSDSLDEQSLIMLFERLDLVEKYSDMMRIAISYPEIICRHYDATCDLFKYNITNKWNGDLIETEIMTTDQWKMDLLTTILRIENGYVDKSNFVELIREKVFKNIEDLYGKYKKMKKRMYSHEYDSDDSMSSDN